VGYSLRAPGGAVNAAGEPQPGAPPGHAPPGHGQPG